MEENRKQSSRRKLVQTGDIPAFIQRPGFCFDDVLSFFSAIEPARFNNSKPHGLRVSDDTWAALKLRVDPLARDLLDPHRSYVGAAGVGLLIVLVFLAIRPGWESEQIISRMSNDDKVDEDDAIYDDYLADDEWERKHNYVDDVVVAELEYLNATLDKSMLIWRIGLVTSLVVLFGSVIFIAILMERRNASVDDCIRDTIEEMRPRLEDEGLSVEYRTRASQQGIVFFVGKYIRPSRVVIFRYLELPLTAEGSGGRRAKKTSSFFSEDYQMKYFPPVSTSMSMSPRISTGVSTGSARVNDLGNVSSVRSSSIL